MLQHLGLEYYFGSEKKIIFKRFTNSEFYYDTHFHKIERYCVIILYQTFTCTWKACAYLNMEIT